MPGTTPNLGLRYPLATEAPDGPGAMLQLATDLDALGNLGGWVPTLGGTGATLGANAGADGTFFKAGKHVVAKGRLVFGSAASFGTGTAAVGSLPAGSIDMSHSTGYGFFLPVSGNIVPVFFTPADGANMHIRPIMTAGSPGTPTSLGVGFNLGNPAQSSQLLFTLDITLS